MYRAWPSGAAAGNTVTAEDLAELRRVIREELRAAGLRRPMPDGLGRCVGTATSTSG